MSVEATLTALLKTVCMRTFPDFAPPATARPYVTYQQIGGQALAYLDGTLPSKENADIQINVWADTRADAVAKIKAIEVLLAGATGFQATALGARANDFDADIPVYGCRQDWSIWCDR